MYQRDYILRMIEMLGQLIRGILGLIKKGDFQKANEALEIAYIDFLKQDAAFFHSIPIHQLTQKLLEEHNFTHHHLEILGQLFYTQAELCLATGKQNGSLEFFEKSLVLLEFSSKESKTYSDEKMDRLEIIHRQIEKLKMSPTV